MRWLGGYAPQYRKIESEKMEEWLKSLESDSSGYKMYYTWRKKHINETNGLALEQKEYWMNCGRLAELHYMNMMSTKILKEEEKSKKREIKEK